MTAAAARKRAQRRRERLGLARLTVELPEAEFIAALIDARRIPLAAAMDRSAVEAAAGALLTDWAARWRSGGKIYEK
jgi:hypothetical protein